MLSPEIYQAIECCLSRSIPFAVWAAPAQQSPTFISAPSLLREPLPKAPDKGFFVCEFAQPFAKSHWIPAEMDAEQTLRHCQSMTPSASALRCKMPLSIDREDYLVVCSELVRRLKERGNAKTVLSTLQVEKLPGLSAAQIFGNLMKTREDAMRFCYHHPATGCWIGATPELLLAADAAAGRFATMALAGTCSIDQWDDKNLHEHQVVVDYICDTLSSLGVEAQKSERKAHRYANIYHLRTDIDGHLGYVDPVSILDALNPTPALCGYPRHAALKDIAELEEYPRKCYGGCIGWLEEKKIAAYVNIRSAKLCDDHCQLYVGGGIMPDSVPEAEWEEVLLKRQSILNSFIPPSKK